MSKSLAHPFDICPEHGQLLKAKMSTPEHSNKRQRMGECSQGATSVHHLRLGMTLVKNFLERKEQIEIVQMCQHLDVGPGGFYQPEYKNGAKLKLWMMCLGKNWDPVSCSYGTIRSFDGAQAPAIPEEFKKNAQSAINAVGGVPLINPDICIVNFYNDTGRLVLHQDKDESRSSIEQGLPVISMSIGDTAEFMFGDTRDKSKASKINLRLRRCSHIRRRVQAIVPWHFPLKASHRTNLVEGRNGSTSRTFEPHI